MRPKLNFLALNIYFVNSLKNSRCKKSDIVYDIDIDALGWDTNETAYFLRLNTG